MIKRAYILAAMLLAFSAGSALCEEPPAPVAKQPVVTTTPDGKKMVEMNFKDATVEDVIKYISALTGKNFIIDDKVTGRGKITVISPSPLTEDEAYEVFQAILGVKELTIAAAGKVLKIIPQQEARQSTIETLDGPASPGDRYVTRIVPLKNIDVNTALKILDPLRSKYSSIVPYEPTNTLFITDGYSNIDRLMGIIDAIDIAQSGSELKFYKVRFASVEQVAETIRQTVTETAKTSAKRPQAAPAPGQPAGVTGESAPTVKILSETRTNSLIVIATPELHSDIEDLLKHLDVEIPSGTGKINVYTLKYADAEAMAGVLNSISKSAAPKDKPIAGAKPVQPQVQPPTATAQVKGQDISASFDEPVSITAHKPTNALVIFAAPQDFLTLKEVIERLDVRRPQVLIETYIMEVSLDKTRELGVEWRTTSNPGSGDRMVVGGTSFGKMSGLAGLATNPFSSPTGLALAAIDGTIKVGDTTFPNIGVMVSAMQSNGDIEVLATPNLLTTDNEEAEIVVSNNIPFQTNKNFDSNGRPVFSYEYRDVGLKLNFTPQINEEGYVKLKLNQEISDVAENIDNAPKTTKRSAKTSVVVKNGATVIIGGLIQDKKNTSTSEVPCLGDIPLLGMLFKNNLKANTKTNLMIFMTPYIINDMKDLDDLSIKKRKQYEKFAEEMRRLYPSEGADEVQEQKTAEEAK